MARVMRTGFHALGNPLRDAYTSRWTGILSLLPVRCVARTAAWREMLGKGNAAGRTVALLLDPLLDLLARNPLYCARVRHEILRELRLRKKFRPGWRKACFEASARRFGPLA